MTIPKLSLNLNEENELAFKISIEGSSSDIGATKPRFRLLVSEHGKEGGMVYPAETSEDGSVVVRLPSTETFSEEVDYRGKLEVILGNHYFVPTEVDIEFIRPLKVEAVVVTKNHSSLREEKENGSRELSDTSVSVSSVVVRNKKGIREAQKPPAPPAKKTWDDLTESEKEKLVAHLKEKKLKELRQKKLLEKKKRKMAEDALKEQLKELMSSSLEIED